MKQQELVDVYYCDCCGKKLGLEGGRRFLSGCQYSNGEVSYEPVLKGDYCDTCVEVAQHNWSHEGRKGFVGERYDSVTPKGVAEEVAALKAYRESLFSSY